MSLTPEWRGRIDRWNNVLKKLFFFKIADIPLDAFVTTAQVSPAEARKGRFKPMPPGTAWGAKWEYAWFRGVAKVPQEAKGERLVMHVEGNEGRVIIDDRETGGADRFHREFLLSPKAVPGTEYDLLIETYAGHGPTPCGEGPVPDGTQSVPEPKATQTKATEAHLCVFNEDVYQAWIDLQSLIEVRDKLEKLDPNSLRLAEIDAGLRDFSLIADLELPRAAMLKSIRDGRKRLKPLFECTNGSTSPLLYCFGHSHIDVAWLWPLAETERKCGRTFATQITLMEQYPEFKFLQSQPHLYRMTQRLYPELYQRIKAQVKAGRWIPEGGMWVEPDTNLAGGEALIRQFIHGKRFYKDELGVESELMWLPDVFGYSGALPQIMAGCGIKYFSTQKIFWNYNGGETFPHNTFWWQGIDGTRVLSHFHNDYNARTNPAAIMQRWEERVQKDGIDSRIVPFGHGDGGGGPTRDHLEFLRRQGNLEGVPRTKIASPIEYFKAEEKRGAPLPVYAGELYFQAHRGTYTSQARVKQGNRRCEFALREAEMWGVAAQTLASKKFPLAEMDEAWKSVLLNQFHDILPGSSIHRVYEEAEALHAEILQQARQMTEASARALLKNGDKSFTVLNSLSWPRTALVPLPKGFSGAAGAESTFPAQNIGGTEYTEVAVPACGWASFASAKPAKAENAVKATASSLENELVRLAFNAQGEIESCLDKATGRELAAAPLNSFRMYKDVPRSFDAWDLDSPYKFLPVELAEKAKLEVVASGPLAAVLRIRRKLNNSEMTQEVWLHRNSRRVEFRTQVEWQEKHKLLKVNFPLTLHAEDALHEIQFGHLRRPTHASRPFDADRFEVSAHKWTALTEEKRGAAVLNDCKYGVSVEGGSINLTLLKSAQAPDMTADRGLQEFTYALYFWNGAFAESNLIREGYELNVPVLQIPGASGANSLFQLDQSNVIIETVKPAEDGSGDVIVRLYEAMRTATACKLQTGLPVKKAVQTNMLEQGNTAVPLKGGEMALEFRPFEIKTLRLKC